MHHPTTPLITPPLLILVGPTGIGKTAVGVELCELLNGEVISADSMQIYRGCDIATAKPTPEERARAPHHLINIREPTERYSAAEWAQEAQAAIQDIIKRGRQPIILGGTGFYLRALLEPQSLAEVPPDPALRLHLESEVKKHGNEWLHNYLATLDQDAAQRLHPNDVRRVIRAIEVAWGRNAQQFNKDITAGKVTDIAGVVPLPSREGPGKGAQFREADLQAVRAITFGLDMPRSQLYARLEKRIDNMLEAGMLDELRNLINKGVALDSTLTLMQGLGYRQMLPALDDPELLPQCIALWKRDTRRYAKRQLTWFRHQLPVQWLSVEEGQSPREIAEHIVQEWQQNLE